MADDFSAKSTLFMSWLAAQPNASINPNIKLADYRSRNAGRGVQALADIPADTDLFSIPRNSILSVQTSDLPSKLPSVFAPSDEADDDQTTALSPWTALILILIYEHLRPESPWKPYLDILPTHFDTLMFWSPDELAELRGCAVTDKIGRAAADDDFRRTVVPVVQQHKAIFHADGHADEAQLLALAHRMGSTIMAYAFDIERELDGAADTAADEDGYVTEEDEETLPKGMVPMADMLNADAQPNASLFMSARALTMRTLRPVRSGDEILNDYGQVPRSDLLRRYGYITPRYAPFDCVEVSMEDVVASVRTLGNTDEADLDKRLVWLDKQGLLDGSYDLVWQEHGGDRFYMSPIMSCVVRTLLINQAHYKVPAADPEGGEVSFGDIRQVMTPVLESRLAQYAGDFDRDAELLKDQSVNGRLRMAIEVRHGEMQLLHAALKALKADDMDHDGEPQSKKRKVG